MTKNELRSILLGLGADSVGFARCEPVEEAAWESFSRWLAEGKHGALKYMEAHAELRRDPRLLLPGAQTIISTAWLYNPPILRHPSLPYLARYAYCRDYHKGLRSILRPLKERLEKEGIGVRICVDSAPIMERYWAVKSGAAFPTSSSLVSVPGIGTRVFLAEILITLPLEPDTPLSMKGCPDCGACKKACHSSALNQGQLDCSKCLSCLTIETPGEAKSLPRKTLMGCDVCQDVCPLNSANRTANHPQFASRSSLLTLDEESLSSLSEKEFLSLCAGTPLMRPGLEGLRRNLRTPVRK